MNTAGGSDQPHFLSSKLGRRIFYYFLIVGLIPTVIFTYFSVGYLRSEEVAKSRQEITKLSKLAGGKIFETLYDQKTRLGGLAHDAGLVSLAVRRDRAGLKQALIDLDLNDPTFSQITIFDPSGIDLASVGDTGRAPAPDTDQIGVILKGAVVMSGPVQTGSDHLPTVVFYAPLMRDGALAGILAGVSRKEVVWEVTRGIYTLGENEIYILNEFGQVLASSTGVALEEPLFHPSEKSRYIAGPTGAFTLDNDKLGDVICGYHVVFMRGQFGIPDWTVLTVKKLDDALASSRTLMIWFILFSALSVVTIAFVSSINTRAILDPIRRLLEGTRSVAAGDLGHRIEIRADDELGELGNSFNDMSAKLKRTTVSQLYVENIIDSCIDSLMVISPDGVIETVNAAMCRLLGRAESDLIGRPVSEIVAEGESVFMESNLKRVVERGALKNVEAVYRSKNLELIPMSVSISRMYPDAARPGGLVCVGRDLREIRRLMAERAAAAEREKMAELDRMAALGRLTGGVAHEFNNVLSGMIGMAELLKRGVAQGDEVDIILKEGYRASKIVQDLLLYSGSKVNMRGEVDIARVVQNVLRIVSNDMKIHKISVQFRPPDQPLYITCDESRLQQVLLNLIINSRDAMPGGGSLEIDLGQEKESVVIRVSDSGAGIPESLLNKIFDPFVTTKEVGKGTGLGLSVVSGILKAHGGTIQAANRLQGGAVFTIYLPLSWTAPPTGSEHLRAPRFSGYRVLVVDDESAVTQYCQRTLESIGNRVTVARTVDEALESVNRGTFDFVVCDHSMPGKTGLQFLDILRQRRRSEAGRFVLMTGLSREILKTDAVVIQKPFSFEELVSVLSGISTEGSVEAV